MGTTDRTAVTVNIHTDPSTRFGHTHVTTPDAASWLTVGDGSVSTSALFFRDVDTLDRLIAEAQALRAEMLS